MENPTALAALEENRADYPAHPISQLQAPFEESIVETNDGPESEWVVEMDAQSRRRDLLENDEYERLCGRKWRQRETERYHPFWKLISQMVFGVHLLAKRQAKSEAEVMKILQTHVDEMDGFLERTTEDFLIIRLDIRTRIQYLSLPLGNLEAFDEMLDDRNFRLSLISYNDQIEHAIERFTVAITDSLKDIRKGKEAMRALWHYLRQLADEGCFESESLDAFYRAMTDNMEGWMDAFSKLRRQATSLHKALSDLNLAVTEMQRRVGVASRKPLRSSIQASNRGPVRRRSVRQKLFEKGPATISSRPVSNKPLPRAPGMINSTPATPKKTDLAAATETGESGTRSANVMTNVNSQPKALNRAKSCSALGVVAEAPEPASSSPPRTPGRLVRKFSRSFLPKRSVSERLNTTENRPATAPSRTLRPSRSVSMEHLKALYTSGRPRTQQSAVKPSLQSGQQQTQIPPLGRRNTMKEHISHYLKADRVVEAWDNMAKKSTCGPNSPPKTKDWPRSVFRVKSTKNARARPANENPTLTKAQLERQMSWVHAPELLNTYSFRSRPETAPRIHVLSVQTNLDEEFGRYSEKDKACDAADEASSIITALPTVPPPTPSSPFFPVSRPVTAENRPRTVDCAQA
ncbi:hypothetical protein N7474_007092 [Penicillium riverlandense]|uniref:uncharacterized protein n=1 Tax=Penicillium riverlandense TaxID=1903569 RepID=UPI0025465E48|nr:uncharacterized protein N7474_007092 [Penicillium riverlandense]KAJ5815315.1 hypothetical protein N7474_007092 [Penicillium riverlandense]